MTCTALIVGRVLLIPLVYKDPLHYLLPYFQIFPFFFAALFIWLNVSSHHSTTWQHLAICFMQEGIEYTEGLTQIAWFC